MGAIAFTLGNDEVQITIQLLVAPFLALAGLILLVLVVVGKYRQLSLGLLGPVALFFASSFALTMVQRGDPWWIRSSGRWLLFSRPFKAQVLASPKPAGAELQHIAWDGWGFVPAGNTIMYLVYDPSDSLAEASRRGGAVNLPGTQCRADRVHRLESQWYTALFPTDSDWRDCALANRHTTPP